MKYKVKQVRSFTINDVDKTQDNSPFISLSMSSETPVLRSFGNEILLHGVENIDFSRTKPNGLPLFVNHNDEQLPVGRLKNIRLDPQEKKLRGDAYFSGREEAQAVKNDILDGILSDVSVGYRILQHKVVKSTQKGTPDTVNVTRWLPFECSLCGLPADNSVGIGRSSGEPDDEESELLEDSITQPIEEPGDNPPVEAPPVETQAEVEVENQQEAVEIPAGVEPMPAKMADEEVSEETRNETLETTTPVETVVLEERSLPIDEVIICTDSELLIEPNPELIALRTVALNQKLKTEVEIDQILSRTTDITEARKLLMITEPKTQRVIFQKDNNKMLTNDMITRSLALACKGQFDALEGDARGLIQVTGQRSFSADLFTRTDTFLGDTVVSNMTTGTYGNEGIFQQYIGFLELLRARAVVLAAGAKTRSGSGSMAYVREITATTVVAKAEDSGPAANSFVDFVKVPYLPHALVATVILTDELSKESLVDLQQVLRGDMIKQLALKLDNMAINGVTTPYTVNGLLSSPSAIQNGDLGTPAVPTFAAVNHLKALVDQYAVDLSTCAYICNPLLFALLEATSKGTNLYVPIAADNKINSYKALTSTNLAVNSSFYTLAFGDFSNLEIALMGPTEFMVDIQTRFAEGLTILTARQYVDIGVLQPNGFSKCGNFLLA